MSEEKEYFHGLTTEPAKHDRLVLFNKLIFAIVLGIALAMVVKLARAEPIAQAKAGNVVITVYNEKCTHQDAITNLPMRATWEENGKVYDGCVGAIPQLGVAMFWFTDKTMAVVPIEMFAKLTNA